MGDRPGRRRGRVPDAPTSITCCPRPDGWACRDLPFEVFTPPLLKSVPIGREALQRSHRNSHAVLRAGSFSHATMRVLRHEQLLRPGRIVEPDLLVDERGQAFDGVAAVQPAGNFLAFDAQRRVPSVRGREGVREHVAEARY